MKTALVILGLVGIVVLSIIFGSYCVPHIAEGGTIKEIYTIAPRHSHAYWIVVTDKDKHYLTSPSMQIKGEKLIYEDSVCVKLIP